MSVPRILSIAGSDSGGGAGIQADIKTITMLGGHAMTAITAITAQNTLGVSQILAVPAAIVLAQVDAVVDDIGVDAIKIGMIGSAETAEALADRLGESDLSAVPLVFDPVLIASTGARLTDHAAMLSFTRLMARASVSTPNLDELQAICGMVAGEAIAIADAARRLIEDRGSGAILVTGVRSSGAAIIPTDGSAMATGDLLFDLLYHRGDRGPSQQWYAERIETDDDHGTGCTLSSAIAVGLGRGLPLGQAIDQARIYVRAALNASPGLGHGHGPMGHGLGRAWFGGN